MYILHTYYIHITYSVHLDVVGNAPKKIKDVMVSIVTNNCHEALTDGLVLATLWWGWLAGLNLGDDDLVQGLLMT